MNKFVFKNLIINQLNEELDKFLDSDSQEIESLQFQVKYNEKTPRNYASWEVYLKNAERIDITVKPS